MIFAIPYQPFNAIPIGPITIYMWGIMVAIAFLVGTYFAVKEAKRRGMNVDKIYNLLILIIVGALIGSRIFYFIFYRHEGAAIGLIDFFKVWEGGLSFFGGFVGAFAVGTWYILRTKMGFWRTADLLAPSIAIGHAIGRVGCYLTGLHTGKLTTVPWGIAVDGAVRHSTPMYEFIGLTIIFFILPASCLTCSGKAGSGKDLAMAIPIGNIPLVGRRAPSNDSSPRI